MKVHRIVITPTLDEEGRHRRSSKGPLFDVSFEGHVIVLNSSEPSLEAARFFKARGRTGQIEMWDSVLLYCRFRTDIDRAAILTVREGDGQPRLVKFKSFAPRNELDGDCISRGIPVAQTGDIRPTDYACVLTGKIQGGQEV